ncbi:hypothetical protein LZC94_28565 [Pendulispora albinea]|uniref:Uncharacterized protein n=1 Tax=Pendulispora albinea TaxID=2741071 RepID=A0ABZ2LN96_9BACT
MNEAARKEGKDRRPHGPTIAVRTQGVSIPECLLGRHECRCAERTTCHRDITVGCTIACDPEVEHADLAFRGEEEIVRLDVPVHDPFVVRTREHVEHVEHQNGNFDEGHSFVGTLPAGAKCLSLEQRHDQKRAFVLIEIIVQDGDRARVPYAIGDVGLAPEKAASIGVS